MIDILLFGIRIGSTNYKQDYIYHPLPLPYTFKLTGRDFEVTELRFRLIETDDDILYDLDFLDLLKRLKQESPTI